jgi:hypothetical protein
MATDRIEREIFINASQERVWAVLTEAEHLAGWFGDCAEVDLRPGGKLVFGWKQHGDHHALVEDVGNCPRSWKPTGCGPGYAHRLAVSRVTVGRAWPTGRSVFQGPGNGPRRGGSYPGIRGISPAQPGTRAYLTAREPAAPGRPARARSNSRAGLGVIKVLSRSGRHSE